MALDPALELQELNAILGSPDDPATKQARIAQLYQAPEAPDPAMLSPEATAMGGAGGMGGAPGMSGAPPGNVPDVPVAVPGAGGMGGAGGASGGGGSGGTLGMPPPELLAQSGTSGPGNMPAGAPMPPPMAATEAPLPRPAPARVTSIPETTVKGAPVKPGQAPLTPLQKELSTYGPENFYGKPDLVGRPVTKPEDAAYRALEEEQLTQTREQGEAEAQAIQAGARAEVAAVERGQLVDAELAKRELDRQRQLEQMERGYQEMLADAAKEPIDSERLWNSKSTGEKILSKIALFIGTVGGGVMGNPMMMMNKMDADVERDIQAQKANKGFQLSRLAAEGSLYGMARDRFGSEQAVDQAMRETAWRKIGAELQAFHAKAQDPARRAAIEQLMASTEGKIVDSERQRRLLNDADTIARLRASQAPKGKPPPRNEVAKLIEGLSTQDGIIKKLTRIKELTGKATDRAWGTDSRGAAETLISKLQLDYKRGEQTGTLDKGSLDFFDTMIGKPADFFRNPASESKLDQLIQDSEAKQLQLKREYDQLQSVKTGAPTRGTGSVQH